MAKKQERAPYIEVVTTPKGLRAHTVDDAEKMVSIPQGKVFELVPVSKRSHKQLKTYWAALQLIVKTTGKWPNAEKLHRDIKFTLGYRELIADLKTGEVSETVDSVAIDKMSHEEFCEYMNKAMALLAETVGVDPLAWLDQERAA